MVAQHGRVLDSRALMQVFGEAEELMRTVPDDERREIALSIVPLAANDVGLDLEQASEEAMAFLESFPVPGRAAVDLAQEASGWLALRTATDERRARLRSQLSTFAEAAAADCPLTAGVLRQLAAEPAAADPRQDDLWVALARAIVEERFADLC
jgi:acetylornithine deacetylase/succinyl-diaminopimelate desuccinylase-like protein